MGYSRMRCKKALVSPPELEHNTHLLKSERFLLIPMLKFFGLPDYCFEYVHVPRWARCRPGPPPMCDAMKLLGCRPVEKSKVIPNVKDDDDTSVEISDIDPVDFL